MEVKLIYYVGKYSIVSTLQAYVCVCAIREEKVYMCVLSGLQFVRTMEVEYSNFVLVCAYGPPCYPQQMSVCVRTKFCVHVREQHLMKSMRCVRAWVKIQCRYVRCMCACVPFAFIALLPAVQAFVCEVIQVICFSSLSSNPVPGKHNIENTCQFGK